MYYILICTRYPVHGFVHGGGGVPEPGLRPHTIWDPLGNVVMQEGAGGQGGAWARHEAHPTPLYLLPLIALL